MKDILEEIKKKQLNYQGKVRVRLSKKLK